MNEYKFYESKYSLTGTRVIKMVSPNGQVRLFDKMWFATMSGILSDEELWDEGTDPETIAERAGK